MKILRYILPIFLFALTALALPPRDIMRFSEKRADLMNVRITKDHHGKTVFSLLDNTYATDTATHITDLVLSFNQPSKELVRDDTNHYKVRHASYLLEKGSGVLGTGGARFFRKADRVELETASGLWLSECGDLGSFTIEFRFKPASLTGTQTLIKRIGYLSGIKNGFEILLINGRIHARFYGVFRNAGGHPVDVYLERGTTLKTSRWYHFMISYDRLSGKIGRYLNGDEEETAYITRTREPYIDAYMPLFRCEDLPLVVIGKDFFGIIDEIRIAHREYSDLKKETALAYQRYKAVSEKGRVPVNREGVLTSPVYTFPLSGTKITSFDWEEKLPPGTFVWMEMRISDYLFGPNDATPRWYRISRGQRGIYDKKTEEGDYLRGKYLQWRAHLIASPDGKRAPSLYDVAVKYENDLPPGPPSGVRISSVKDKRFTIRWNKNPESDVGGYRVYYGIQSKKYDGVISHVNGKRIPSAEHIKGNIIEIEITNDVINENKKLDPQSVLHYPALKNTILYYVAVSAYDSYKPDTPFNHESELSSEITVRPFAGSEIDP